MPAGLHCLLVGSINYWHSGVLKCGRPGMADNKKMACSHDKGTDGRSVTRVHGSLMGEKYKSVTEAMKMQQVDTEL